MSADAVIPSPAPGQAPLPSPTAGIRPAVPCREVMRRGSGSSFSGTAHPASVSCARLGRVIPPSDCAALICRTGEAADLQSCFVCPAGQALAAGCPDHARLVRRRDAVPDAVVLLRVLGEALRDDPSAPQISIRALARNAERSFGGDGDPYRLARAAQRCGLTVTLRPWAIIRDAACRRFALKEV